MSTFTANPCPANLAYTVADAVNGARDVAVDADTAHRMVSMIDMGLRSPRYEYAIYCAKIAADAGRLAPRPTATIAPSMVTAGMIIDVDPEWGRGGYPSAMVLAVQELPKIHCFAIFFRVAGRRGALRVPVAPDVAVSVYGTVEDPYAGLVMDSPVRPLLDVLVGRTVAVSWGHPTTGTRSDSGTLLAIAACNDGLSRILGPGEVCPCGRVTCITAFVGAPVGFNRQVDLDPFRLARVFGSARVTVHVPVAR